MDCPVAAIFVVSRREVRSLWSMSQNSVRRYLSVSICAINQPLLSSAGFHGSIVLPIQISSVKIIVNYILS
jgi:hypothetical protein